LPVATADRAEVLSLVESERLHGRGIGWIDVRMTRRPPGRSRAAACVPTGPW
jgi:hypothetical protein